MSGPWEDFAPSNSVPKGPWDDFKTDSSAPKASSLARRAADIPLGLVKGIVDLPSAAVGLADIPTNGLAGKAAGAVTDALGSAADAVGLPSAARPSNWSEGLGGLYSPETKQAQQAVHQGFEQGEQAASDAGDGSVGKFIGGAKGGLAAMAKNPAAIVPLIAENYGGMKAIAKGTARAMAPMAAKYSEAVKAGTMTQEAADAALANAAGRTAAVGEGLLTAGQNTAQVEQQNPDATFGDRAMQGLAGAITGGISRGVSKIPGLGDVEANMALKELGSNAKTGLSGGRLAAAGKGILSEGLLEEFPQSMQEQVWQNLGTNKPWDSGLAEQGVSGLVAGAGMGGAMGLAHAQPKTKLPDAGPLSAAVNAGVDSGATSLDKPLALGYQAGPPLVNFPDGTTMTQAEYQQHQAQQEQSRLDGMIQPIPATPEQVKALGYQPGTPLVVFPDGTAMTRAEYVQREAEKEQSRLDGMVQPADKPEVSAPQSGSLAAAAQKPNGSFSNMDELAGLIGQEKQDVETRRQGIADTQQLRRSVETSDADNRVADSMAKEAEQRRRAVLDSVLSDESTVDHAKRFSAELKRQGFRDTTPTDAELATVQRFNDVKNAQAEPAIEPSQPNELDAAAMGIKERSGISAPKPGQRDKIAEITQLVSDGWKLNGKTLVSPTGKKRNLNFAERYAAIKAKQGTNDVITPAEAVTQQAQREEGPQQDSASAVSEEVAPTQAATDGVNQSADPAQEVASTAAPVAQLQEQLAKTEPFTEQSQELTQKLQDAITSDAKSAIDAGDMPVYKVTDHVSVAIHPSAQNPGMVQVTRYTKDGVIGDSQYNNIDEAVRNEGLIDKPRIAPDAAKSVIGQSIQAEAEYQQRKAAPQQVAQPAAEPHVKQVSTREPTLAKRDDLVGAIMRVTGGKGIAANQAQTITGDKAGSANAKVRGLFTNTGTADLGDVAMLLREEEGYSVKDGEHLSELIREQASGNPVYSMERTEREASANAEKQYKQSVNDKAGELGLKKIGGKRTLEMVEADIEREEKRLSELEATAERKAIQGADAIDSAIGADMTEADFMRWLSDDIASTYTSEEIQRAEQDQADQADARLQANAIADAEERAQGDSRQGNGNQPAAPEGSRAKEGTGSTEDGITYKEGKGLATGKWFAQSEGQMSNAAATKELAAESLRSILATKKANEDRRVALDELAKSVAGKIKEGVQPTDKELYDLFGLEPRHDYVHQEAVGTFLVKHLGVSRNRIKESLGKAGGVRRSDFGGERNIAYPRKLHEVFGRGLTLTGQTNAQAAEQFAQQQSTEPAAPTKEQADRERDAVPFAMQQESQPKPQGRQTGLFTADGRVSSEAKASNQNPIKNETPDAAKVTGEISTKNQESIKKEVKPGSADSKAPWQMTRHEWYSAKNNDRAETFGSAGKRNGAAEAMARIERKARLNYGVTENGEPVDHRQVVEKAISEGKPVPDNVLADYPGLKSQPKADAAPEGDWLSALFGQSPTAERSAPDEKKSAVNAQDKSDRVDAAIAMLTGDIEANNAAAAEMAARKYKTNKKQIELNGDGPGKNASMSVSAINESRRRRAIEASLNASASIKKAIEFIAENPDGAFKQVLEMEREVTKQFNEGFLGPSAKLDSQLDMAVGSMINAGQYSGEGSAGRKLRMAAHAYFAEDKAPAITAENDAKQDTGDDSAMLSRRPDSFHAIRSFVRSVINGSEALKFFDFAKVDKEEARALQEKTGLYLSGYSHSINDDAVRHVMRKHGSMEKEIARGQVGINADDIAMIPEIISSYDLVERGANSADGKPTIVYQKTFGNGVTYYVEEVRTGREKLMAKTMWKVGPAVPRTTSEDGVAHTSETSGSQPNSNIHPDGQKGKPSDGFTASRGQGQGMSLRDLKAVKDRVSKGFKNLPNVHVLEDPSYAPEGLRDFIEKAGATNDVEGATHEGEIYLFASGLANEERAEHVLATHEITHYGLRGTIGSRNLDSVLNQIWMANKDVRDKAREIRDRLGMTSNVGAVEEVLADMPDSELVKLKGWKRMAQVVRDWLHSAGFEKMAARLDKLITGNMSDQQKADLFVSNMVRNAREWVKNGKPARGYDPGMTMLSSDTESSPKQTDTPAFRKWFGDSKVVDANGDPLVVYHGTGATDISEFKVSTSGTYGGGIYLTPEIRGANDYAIYRGAPSSTVYPVYAAIKNPASGSEAAQVASWKGEENAREELIKRGYDGVVDMRSGEIVAFYPEQIKSAIGNNGQFDATNPDIRFSRASTAVADLLKPKSIIVGDNSRVRTPEQLAFFKRVGRDVDKKNAIAKTLDYLRSDFWKKMAVGLVDQFRGLRDLNDNNQSYWLARAAKGTAGALETFLHHGKLSIRDGVYDGDQSGGFVDRLGVPLHGELDDFLWYVAANRAEKLSSEDRENLFTPEDIAAGKSLANGTTDFDYTVQTGPLKGKVTRNRSVIYADANRVFNEFQKNALDIAEQSGLIDPEARKYWESEFYVPFYRVSEDDGEFVGAKMGNALVRQQAFKKLKGGTDKLNSDLLSNTLLNFSHLIEASAKNRAAKSALEAAGNMGVATRVAGTMGEYAKANGSMLPPGTKKTVWYQDGGKKIEYLVDDPFVMTAITSLEYAGMRNGIMGAMGKFKNALTIGVTASPAFKVRNLIRDSIQAIGTSDLSANPVKNIAQGWKLTNKESQVYVSALASGGIIRFGTMLEGSESSRVRQLVKQGVKDSSILDSENKVRAFYDQYLEPAVAAYNELGNRSEEINRVALYDQLIKQGKSHIEAAMMARDLMDFSMQGSFNTIRFLTQVVPFMNARLQGLYKLGRAAKDDPAKMATTIGACALASIGLMLAYRDDDDWKRREDFDRDNYWWFKFAGTEFRIPKPFEVGAVASIAERSLEYLIDNEMTGQRFAKIMGDMLMNNLSMNPVPQMVKPIIDLYANKDSFTNRPIESQGMQNLDKDKRYNSSTSMVARGLSSATGGALSPVQYDHLARAYFGWLGSFVVGGGDMAARAVSDEPTRPTADYFKLATQGFLKEQGTGGSRYTSMLYEQAQALEQAYGTYRQLIKDGKIQEAREYAVDHKEQLAKYKGVETVKRGESKLNERIRLIERSNLDPEVKKERIAGINQQKERLAKLVAPGV